MKAILLLPALMLAQITSAAKLEVRALVTPGRTITIERCSCPTTEGGALRRSASERSFPGTIELDIRGGVAPYQVIWHDAPKLGFLALSVMPGQHRVTVIDAEGTAVTRSVHVGTRHSRRWERCPCDASPLQMPASSPKPARTAPHRSTVVRGNGGTDGRPVVDPVGKRSEPTPMPVVDHGRDTDRAVDHFTGGGGSGGGQGGGNKHVVVQPAPPMPVQRR